MTTEQKGSLIQSIIAVLRHRAAQEKKAFDGGDTFFALAFKSDEELEHIAKLCGL
jgi:hypothetical protein